MAPSQTFEILIAGEERFQEELHSCLNCPPYALLRATHNAQLFAHVAARTPFLILAQFDAPQLQPFPFTSSRLGK